MYSDTREDVVAAFAAMHASVSRVLELSFDALTTPELFACLEKLEVETRRLPVPGHALINQIAAQASAEELGGKLGAALANRLRIASTEANRRIAEAKDLGPRRALTGEALPAQLAATAQAQRDGRLGASHIHEIRGFLRRLPAEVDVGTREQAEAELAARATWQRPEEVADYAGLVSLWLNPDGTVTDEDRARRRGVVIGKQGPDGMSKISGHLDPQARALFDAVLAKLAEPGMCNPADDAPVLDGPAPEESAARDTRSAAQRNHDGLAAGLRGLIASGELGQHRGLPVTVIVTTTLKELEAGAGRALTAGGTLLPMSDVLKMAGGAHHYLAIYDKGKSLALYHTKRLASAAQRIMLLGKERGCTAPGCDVPGYWAQVHHVNGYTSNHRTDINELTLACGPDNLLAETGWTTRKNAHGDTEWIPPRHLDRGQPRINTFHHPEQLFHDGDDDDESGEHEVA